MKRLSIITFLLTFIFTGMCFAAEIKGKISSIDKAKKTIQISGVTIQSGDAWIEDEQDRPLTINKLVIDDYLDIQGKFIGSAELKAKKIEKEKPQCSEITSKITTLDLVKREIIINGIKIKVPADAWLEGPSNVKIPLELFAAGYKVTCKGEWSGNAELTAFKITVD